MIKIYIKQALQMLKENRLVSTVSIVGTALAISFGMVLIMVFQIKTANYPPEDARDRYIFSSIRAEPKPGEKGHTNNTGYSYDIVKECLYTLQTPEVVTASIGGKVCQLALPTKKLYADYSVRWTDANFWKAYDFHFLEGQPFTGDDVESRLPLVVINQEIAQLMFDREEVIGETLLINRKPHRIVGVVKEVSKAATSAYAQAWAVLTSDAGNMVLFEQNRHVGYLNVMLLAKKKEDIPAVKDELKRSMKQFSDNMDSYMVSERTWNFYQMVIGKTSDYVTHGLLIILFLLLLPAINLTGITLNNIRQRSSEIGIRKAFGATKGTLMWQILTENLVVTTIGALIGFGFSFLFIYISRDFLLSSDTMISMNMLLQPLSFIAVVIFCLLMNLLSAGIPAWRIARQQVVTSLTGNPS